MTTSAQQAEVSPNLSEYRREMQTGTQFSYLHRKRPSWLIVACSQDGQSVLAAAVGIQALPHLLLDFHQYQFLQWQVCQSSIVQGSKNAPEQSQLLELPAMPRDTCAVPAIASSGLNKRITGSGSHKSGHVGCLKSLFHLWQTK